MGTFSFRSLFGKGTRGRRFSPELSSAPGDDDDSRGLPVGRLVAFGGGADVEDAPLFEERHEDVGESPFAIVTPPRGPSAGSGRGFGDVESGFTADELCRLVPSSAVRVGAVPPSQEIKLPLGVLRAALGVGRPAILLSQLHEACPALFVAPTSEDEDVIVNLSPEKVRRLVAAADQAGPRAALGPFDGDMPRAVERPGDSPAVGWGGGSPWQEASSGGDESPAMQAARTKLPPPRRRPEEQQGRELHIPEPAPIFASAPPSSPFAVEAEAFVPAAPRFHQSATAHHPFGLAKEAPRRAPRSTAAAAMPSSPFYVAAALPTGSATDPSPSPPPAAWPRRFESPFSVVSPADVPAVIESPFARRPVLASPEPEVDLGEGGVPPLPPSEPATLSLRLVELLRSLTVDELGFSPDRVPASVRVTLDAEPLLRQIPSGRITVALSTVVAALDPLPQGAFRNARPGLQVTVPLHELFASLPEAPPPTPPAPTVATTFATPFSIRAEEDATLVNHVPAPEPVEPGRPTDPPPPPWPPFAASIDAPAPAAPSASEPFIIIPESAVPVAPQRVAPISPSLEPDRSPGTVPAVARIAIEPVAPVSMATTPEPAFPSRPPTAVNPFATAPGQASRETFGFDLPMTPFDEDPVPLESLRESTLPPPVAAIEPPPPAAERAEPVAAPAPALPPPPVAVRPLFVPAVHPSIPFPPMPAPTGTAAAPETREPAPRMSETLEPVNPAPSPPLFSEPPGAGLPTSGLSFHREVTPVRPVGEIDSAPPPVLPPSEIPVPTAAERHGFAFPIPSRPETGDNTSLFREVAPPPIETAPAPSPAAVLTPVVPTAPDSAAASVAAPATGTAPVAATSPMSAIEDLSFGYVDDPTQLALRAIFSTDKTLRTQDVVDFSAQFSGIRSCLILTPHATIHSGQGAASDDILHFRERAGGLFEKTASLVRELDPEAREQSFTLRTARGVVSFFSVGGVCLAALHDTSSFQPGVREKLTLVTRSLAEMLGA